MECPYAIEIIDMSGLVGGSCQMIECLYNFTQHLLAELLKFYKLMALYISMVMLWLWVACVCSFLPPLPLKVIPGALDLLLFLNFLKNDLSLDI